MTQGYTFIEKSHIARTPGVCGGRPCIAGTRIRVQDVYVWHERQGLSPDEILQQFPTLTLSDVYAALAYFWDNQESLLQDIAAEEALVAEMKAKQPALLAPRRKAQLPEAN